MCKDVLPRAPSQEVPIMLVSFSVDINKHINWDYQFTRININSKQAKVQGQMPLLKSSFHSFSLLCYKHIIHICLKYAV